MNDEAADAPAASGSSLTVPAAQSSIPTQGLRRSTRNAGQARWCCCFFGLSHFSGQSLLCVLVLLVCCSAATLVVPPHALCIPVSRARDDFQRFSRSDRIHHIWQFPGPPPKNIHGTLGTHPKIKPLHTRHLHMLL